VAPEGSGTGGHGRSREVLLLPGALFIITSSHSSVMWAKNTQIQIVPQRDPSGRTLTHTHTHTHTYTLTHTHTHTHTQRKASPRVLRRKNMI